MEGPQLPAEVLPAAGSASEDVKRFTSWKLNILNAMSVDKRVKAGPLRLATRIAEYTNKHTRMARVSMATLADDMNVERSTIRRYQQTLVDLEWLAVKPGRYRLATEYRLQDANVQGVVNVRLDLKILRRERRARIAANLPRSEAVHIAAKPDATDRDHCGRFVRHSAARVPQLHLQEHLTDGNRLQGQHLHTREDPTISAPASVQSDRSTYAEPLGVDWSNDDWDAYREERAGIREFDGGFPRFEAEQLAQQDVLAAKRAVRLWTLKTPSVPKHTRPQRSDSLDSPGEQAALAQLPQEVQDRLQKKADLGEFVSAKAELHRRAVDGVSSRST